MADKFKTCRACGRLFVADHHSQQFCSDDCRKTSGRIYNTLKKREYYDKKRKRKQEQPQETVNKHCKHTDCIFRGHISLGDTCDYFLMTGAVRGCKISECDKYESGKRKVGISL